MECFDFKKMWSTGSLSILLPALAFLFVIFMFNGKSKADLEAIAVSPSEQYIACFEYGNEDRIHCFCADGSLAFTYNIPADINAGGYCTLWFEEDVLCALFYRKDHIVCFALDGTILDIVDNEAEKDPPKFPSFSRMGRQYIYKGSTIDVTYDKGCYFGYWLLGAERTLTITPKKEEPIIAYSWTAIQQ